MDTENDAGVATLEEAKRALASAGFAQQADGDWLHASGARCRPLGGADAYRFQLPGRPPTAQDIIDRVPTVRVVGTVEEVLDSVP